MIVYPGETERHIFRVPYPASILKKAYASYKQQDYVTLEIPSTEFEDAEDDENACDVIFNLNQDQSLQLRNISCCKVQLNLITMLNERLVGEPVDIQVGPQFHRSVIQ